MPVDFAKHSRAVAVDLIGCNEHHVPVLFVQRLDKVHATALNGRPFEREIGKARIPGAGNFSERPCQSGKDELAASEYI